MSMIGLMVTGTEDELSYGGGVIRVFPEGVEVPPGLADEYDLLDCGLVEIQDGKQVSLYCRNGSCVKCLGSACGGGPPPPTIPRQHNVLALRRDGVSILGGEIRIQVGPAEWLGPILVLEGAPPSSLDENLRVNTWARVQNQAVVLNLYSLQDLTGSHPLSNKVIAIPVPHLPHLPNLPHLPTAP